MFCIQFGLEFFRRIIEILGDTEKTVYPLEVQKLVGLISQVGGKASPPVILKSVHVFQVRLVL